MVPPRGWRQGDGGPKNVKEPSWGGGSFFIRWVARGSGDGVAAQPAERCPLYPQEWTFGCAFGMSALCQKQTSRN